VSAGSGAPQYVHLIECLRVLAAKDALRGSVAWICHPDFIHACQLVDNTSNETTGVGLQIERRMLAEKPVDRLVGYPYYTTTQLGALSGVDSATSVILGAWQDCLIANWKGIEIRASDVAGTAFETDQLWVRGIARMDTNVRHLDSFLALVDVQQASGA
jgi:HK97 family phage major capsid protein